MKKLAILLSFLLLRSGSSALEAQSLGNAGTLQGTVKDATGAVVPQATVRIHNPVSGYQQAVSTDASGNFRLTNIPPNSYHLDVSSPGFTSYNTDVAIRNSVPITLDIPLAVAGNQTVVNVEAGAADLVEVDPSAHVDTDRDLISKIPMFDPGGGLSQAITMSTGGVAADGNGFFHPLGDHAQTTFVIDGQPISDQQSKVFSTQLPTSAVQSMEVTTGTPSAEFGDKTSLVAQVTTRSGLGAMKTFGNVDTYYGSFGSTGGDVALGFGNEKFGNFIALDGGRSGRFLDTPEFTPFHDVGNNQTIFDRLDFQPNATNVVHLNLFAARNWIQIPDDYDQLATFQDQRQRVLTWSFAPGFQHTFNSSTLLTINPYIRKDQFNYYPSRDLFDDLPATQAQQRQLLNWGVKADIAATRGRHNIKAGIDLKQTRLLENFQFGVTNPTFDSPCVDANGAPVPNTTLTNPLQCAGAGFQQNPGFSARIHPFDLSRGGSLFAFHAADNIDQYAFYVNDSITAGKFVFNVGVRFDRYDGLVTATSPQPRVGIAYNIKKTGTVLRAAYARTFETPFNENLLLSSATGLGGLAQNLFGSVGESLHPGNRNQFNTGFQQAIGKYVLIDGDYFWKYTHNAYDFNTLLNTTITFPIVWHNSKLDGVTGRVSTTNIHGFQSYWTFGHTRARYFPPETGGLVFQGAPLAAGVFRIDHDQAFQSTLNMRYQRPHNAEWIAFIYRYDSGLVVSGVPDAGAALIGGAAGLTPNQQVTLGLACNGMPATVANPISTCVNSNGTEGRVTSKLLVLPQGGYGGFPSQENDDHNPDRVKPRNLFNVGIGTDNLLHREGPKRLTASLQVENLTNQAALYNFLSTFSGTHFLQPRTVVAKVGFVF
ncbi:MAG TPA: TonB-dependent receptor [Bryobacteraceae bacterium]|nr:TonB-dependent receptor [Bryobacteraceae bacterium]